MKNKKGFTLVELLAVIVVLAIVMGLAVVGISSVLQSTRKSAFASDAKSYLEGARALVRADEANVMMGGTSTHTPRCNQGTASDTKTFNITEVKLDSGGKSPFTNAAYTGTIKVTCTWTDNSYSKYTYYIYLTDGTWKIGTSANPLEDSTIDANDVTT